MNETIKSKVKCENKMIENIRKEYTYSILDLFENLLDEKDINIPSDDREGDESEARIYGSEYYDMENKVNTLLENYGNDIIACNVRIKSGLSRSEVVDSLISELGYDERGSKLLTDRVLYNQSLYIPGGLLIRDNDGKWTLKYFYVPNKGNSTDK